MPTQQQLEYAKRQTSFAWAKYYEEVNSGHNDNIVVYRQNARILEHQDELPIHLVREIEEMAKKLKTDISCPICMEVIEEGKLKISICGHKFCEECFPELDRCAICRRQFKNNR